MRTGVWLVAKSRCGDSDSLPMTRAARAERMRSVLEVVMLKVDAVTGVQVCVMTLSLVLVDHFC